MLDPKFVRENPDLVREAMTKKGIAGPLDEFLELDTRRRQLLTKVEAMKAERNKASDEIGRAKREGSDASEVVARMKQLSEEIKSLDEQVREIDGSLRAALLEIPSLPHESAPMGAGEEDNVERPGSRWGEIPEFDFEPKPHWELGLGLGIFDFERGVKISGSRFYVTLGKGAALVRGLVNFFIDIHTREHGYQEIYAPYLVRRECMEGTGQLPKFEEDAFRTDPDDLFLIPTSEVSVTNFYRDEILPPDVLPIDYVSYSACFRREAGAAGRDTRGLIRVHQFDKVEMVKFVTPETSYDEYEKLTNDALDMFRRLEIPHRVMDMCTGDLGFTASAKCDPEAWFPAAGKYIEVSSCSNFEDFQARRANIRFRRTAKDKPEFVHTLNGSGLAVGRTLAAILELNQRQDGSVAVPKVLVPYVGFEEIRPGSTCD